MSEITYEHPGEIDGDPYQVASKAADQLSMVLAQVNELIEATVKQVENAGRQQALDDPQLFRHQAGTAGDLDEWWREHCPAQAARAEGLRVVGEKLPPAARALAYAVSRGE